MTRRIRHVPAITALLAIVVLLAGVDAQQPTWTFTTVVAPGATDITQPRGVAVDTGATAGGILFADAGTHTIRRAAGLTSTAMRTLGGLAGVPAWADGGAIVTAGISSPTHMVMDSGGTIFFTDTENNAVRRLTPSGTINTYAGKSGASFAGSVDAIGTAARFKQPDGIAIDPAGNLFVADNCTIRRINLSSAVTTVAGVPGSCGTVDGAGSDARLNTHDLGVDNAGNVYFVDTSHTIRKMTMTSATTGVVTTIAGQAGVAGYADGTGSAARFNFPLDLAVDAATGTSYVADRGNAVIRRVTSAGVVTTFAGTAGPSSSSVDGTGPDARFNGLEAITIAPGGTLYVAEFFRIRAITTAAVVTTVPGSVNTFPDSTPGLYFDASANRILVADIGNTFNAGQAHYLIRALALDGTVTTLAGTLGQKGSADGAARVVARFNTPSGVAVGSGVRRAVSDTGNHVIRIIANDFAFTLAGSPGVSGADEGSGFSAKFNAPRGIAFGPGDRYYVADSGNHAIRTVTNAGVVATFAGVKGTAGAADGPGTTATFNAPRGVAVDSDGAVYVADTGNHVIRKISSGGVVTTLAGLAGSPGSADGVGALARFSSPSGVAVFGGAVYVADTANSTIRAIAADGSVTTIGGTAGATGTADGSGGTARLNAPEDVAVDASGALYIADTGNGALRIGYPGSGTAPVVTKHPSAQTVPIHQPAQFSCAATGVPMPFHRWELGAAPLSEGSIYTGTDTPTLTVLDPVPGLSGAQYRCAVTNAAGTSRSAPATLTVTLPTVALAPARINLASYKRPDGWHVTTGFQAVAVSWNNGAAALWTVTADQPWILLGSTPTSIGANSFTASGSGSATFYVIGNRRAEPDIVPGTLATATLTLSSPEAGVTKTAPVTFTWYDSAGPAGGVFDTPADNATGLSGSLALTGWAVDEIGVAAVQIWRDPVGSEFVPQGGACCGREGKIFIGDAIRVPGARPDVEQIFPSFPEVDRAGWGYMVLTHGLPNKGNGTYKLYAFALDTGSASVALLGTKTIALDNANATKPFGAIDTPGQGATASGLYTNFGWALTPGTCAISPDGVKVSIDSGPLLSVSYGDARSDVAGAFAGYTNSAGASGHYTFDTAALANGLHTVGWIATDNCGRAEGIGSRFFTVANSASGAAATAVSPASAAVATPASQEWSVARTNGSTETPPVARDGTRVVRTAEGERIELQLPGRAPYAARQIVNELPRDLPIGSSFGAVEAKFYWQPAAGFLGAFDLEFTAGIRSERVRAVVGPPIRMMIDTPRAGNVLSASGFTLGGWAVDLGSLDGAGIDTLHVWAYPVGGGAPVFVGVAGGGGPRPDVAALYGPAFAGAGFTLSGTLPPGTYDLVVFAHSAASNTFAAAETVRVIVR